MPLITTIQELKEVSAPANLGIEITTLSPSLEHIERTVLIPEIGRVLYDTLKAAYVASLAPTNTALPAELAALLPHCRRVIAPLAMVHYKNSVLSGISDAGATEKSLENSIPVRMWVNSLQDATLSEEGTAAIESLLDFLTAHKDDYPEWVDSEAYTEHTELLVNTVKLFNSEVNINRSHRLFRQLRSDIKYAEQMVIITNIGDDLYQRLLEGREASDLTTIEKRLLKMIMPVVCNYAIANSPLPVEYGSDGAVSLFTSNDTTGQKNSRKAPDEKTMRLNRERFTRKAVHYLDKLTAWLNATATASVLPEYFNSPLYVAPTTAPLPDSNDSYNSIFTL